MHIAVHARDVHPLPAALAAGMRAAGFKVRFLRPMPNCRADASVDAAVVLGAKTVAAELLAEYKVLGIPCWILELPRLRMAAGKDENSVSLAHGLYRGTLHYLPDAPNGIARVCGPIANRTESEVLVTGQKPDDASHGMNACDIAAWATQAVAAARQYGQRVVYRPHPRAVELMGDQETYGADAVSRPCDENIRTALARAACVVTYNSTSGVDAIDAGVPVVYTAPSELCAYAEYAAPVGAPLRVLTDTEREKCLLRFAACQFTRDELLDGTAARVTFLGATRPSYIDYIESAAPVVSAVSALAPRPRGRPRKTTSPKVS